jgi:peroxiredoxin
MRQIKLSLSGFGLAMIMCVSALAAGSAVNAPAPEFTLPVRGGSTMTLSKLKGKVVMINFWASYCGPCRQEMPLLEKMHQSYKARGFTLLGVNVDEEAKDAEAWLTKMKSPVSFPILMDQKHMVREQYKSYGEVMPMSVFIDRKGNIRNVHRGYKPGDENAYLDQIRNLLKE